MPASVDGDGDNDKHIVSVAAVDEQINQQYTEHHDNTKMMELC